MGCSHAKLAFTDHNFNHQLTRETGKHMSPTKQEKPEWYASGLSFGCTQCGNCCSGPPGYVWLSDEEIITLAKNLSLTTDEFLRRHAHTVDGMWTLNERLTPEGYDCVFLQRDDQGKAMCTVYKARPAQCRTWPFWPDNLKREGDWQRVAKKCPGVNKGTFYPIEKIRVLRDQTPQL